MPFRLIASIDFSIHQAKLPNLLLWVLCPLPPLGMERSSSKRDQSTSATRNFVDNFSTHLAIARLAFRF